MTPTTPKELRRYATKPSPMVTVRAEQITMAAVNARLLDDGPLPLGVVVSSASCNFISRDVHNFALFVRVGSERVHVGIGDWIVTYDDGKIEVFDTARFDATFALADLALARPATLHAEDAYPLAVLLDEVTPDWREETDDPLKAVRGIADEKTRGWREVDALRARLGEAEQAREAFHGRLNATEENRDMLAAKLAAAETERDEAIRARIALTYDRKSAFCSYCKLIMSSDDVKAHVLSCALHPLAAATARAESAEKASAESQAEARVEVEAVKFWRARAETAEAALTKCGWAASMPLVWAWAGQSDPNNVVEYCERASRATCAKLSAAEKARDEAYKQIADISAKREAAEAREAERTKERDQLQGVYRHVTESSELFRKGYEVERDECDDWANAYERSPYTHGPLAVLWDRWHSRRSAPQAAGEQAINQEPVGGTAQAAPGVQQDVPVAAGDRLCSSTSSREVGGFKVGDSKQLKRGDAVSVVGGIYTGTTGHIEDKIRDCAYVVSKEWSAWIDYPHLRHLAAPAKPGATEGALPTVEDRIHNIVVDCTADRHEREADPTRVVHDGRFHSAVRLLVTAQDEARRLREAIDNIATTCNDKANAYDPASDASVAYRRVAIVARTALTGGGEARP